jgi:hypothetical protein
VLTPYAIRGFPFGHDASYQLVWANAFFRQIATGELYPRWLVDVGRDLGSPALGSPAFFFYPPLPFFASSAFGTLSLDPSRQLLAGAILSVCIGVVGAFLWLRNRFEPGPAAIGAALYLLMPYHLVVDFATRNAYAELWGIAWMPWVLISVDVATHSGQRALCLGALTTGLLLLSHPPTSVTFVPLTLAYSGYVAWEARRAGPILVSIASWCLGAGLAAVYVLPALTQGGLVQQESMFTDPRFYYGNWLLFHPELSADRHPMSLLQYLHALYAPKAHGLQSFKPFIAAVTTFQAVTCWLGVGAIRLLEPGNKASAQLRLALVFAVVASSYFFLNFQASDFLWKTLPLLARIQFPYRLNSELLVCTAMIGACLTSVLLRPLGSGAGRIIAWTMAVGVSGLFAINLVESFHYGPIKPKDETEILGNFANPPEHVVPHRTSPAALFRDGAQTAFVSGAGHATVAEWSARHVEIDVAAVQPGTLAIAQQFYSGWSAVITPGNEHAAVDRLRGEYGVLAVEIPAGRSRVSLRLGWTPNERLGWQVSAVCGLILLLMLLSTFRTQLSETFVRRRMSR